ncbi:DUF459 domain-containing protein [Rhizobium sp. LjRoot30]|uniref:SGNH/GDSL hydrolase family protein n=1 Tax=Rhizobium sp. LjRoot30 TaxID=3342320 RepID=UPI003ECD339C
MQRSLAALLALLFGFSCLLPPAYAQDRGERKTLLQLLFGKKPKKASVEEITTPRQTRNRNRKRNPAASTSTATNENKPQPVTKAENAKKILVVGDFLANSLGDGLTAAFETSPNVVIENRNSVASGLVRDDHYDWQAQLPIFIDEIKPAMVVIMIGTNDRQQMSVGGTREKFRTDAWLKEYENRAAKLAAVVRSRNLPLLWVGLPAFQSPSMTADVLQFNGLFRTQVERAGGEFIDVWDGFVDENGKFVITGSDVNGQQVRLRNSDGLNLTRAGRRKLAFYVEKSAKRLLGDTTSPELVRLDASNLPELINLPPAENNRIVRTQPISLIDPELDGGKELLGARAMPVMLDQSARRLLIEKGEMEAAPAGRIDDYRMK